MKLITPPKLIPPCHRAAAMGTLPIEHTKLMNAMNGPTRTFSSVVQMPWPWKNTSFHAVGHNHCEEAGDDVADHQLLSEHVDVGHRVAGGIGPRRLRGELLAPRGALELFLAFLADTDHLLVVVAADHALLQALAGLVDDALAEHEPAEEGEQDDHDRAADELGGGELPTHQDEQYDSELDDEVGRGEHEHHRRDEVGSFLKQRLRHRGRRVRARRRHHPEPRRPGRLPRDDGRP